MLEHELDGLEGLQPINSGGHHQVNRATLFFRTQSLADREILIEPLERLDAPQVELNGLLEWLTHASKEPPQERHVLALRQSRMNRMGRIWVVQKTEQQSLDARSCAVAQ